MPNSKKAAYEVGTAHTQLEGQGFKTGLVTTEHKYQKVHQHHAEHHQDHDECDPTNHENQRQGDTLLSHRGSLNPNQARRARG